MHPVLNGATVLFVENDSTVSEVMCLTLESAGAQVLGPCPTSAAALEVLADRQPDLALLDVQLDDGDVFPVAFALRDRNVRFAFFTGAPQLILPELGHEVVLPKPVGSATLVKVLAALRG